MSERSVVLCTGGFDHTVKLWEAPTGQCLASIHYSECQVNALAISQDKSCIAVAGHSHTRLYDTVQSHAVAQHSTSQGGSIACPPIVSFEGQEGHQGNVTGCGFQKDLKWCYTAGDDGTVKIWKVSLALVELRQRGDKRANKVAEDATRVETQHTGAQTKVEPKQISTLQSPVCGSGSGTRVRIQVANSDAVLVLHDCCSLFCLVLPRRDMRAPQAPTRTYTSHSRTPINTVSLHPNQAEVMTGDEAGCVRVWDLAANRCTTELVPEAQVPIRSIAIAQDAQIVAAVNNAGTCFVWKIANANSANNANANESHQTGVNSIPAMMNASLNDSSHSQFEALHRLDAHPGHYILRCLLSPDGLLLCTCSSDRLIKLWSVQRQFALERTLQGHTGWVWDLTFSADSAYLVSASSDKTARLWDCKTGQVILDYKGHTKAITAIALNDSS